MAHSTETRFLHYLRVEKGLSNNTLIAYEQDLRKLAQYAAGVGKDLLSIEREDLARFIKHLYGLGLEARSVARTLTTVRGLYKYLILDGDLKRDPSSNLGSSRPWQSLPRFLIKEEVDKLLESPDIS
ncbi:MAG TPA: site-specific integrase, partial [Blastocatellia bacterium]|nr:site-specific integrase [Blastocatellia bacterium]